MLLYNPSMEMGGEFIRFLGDNRMIEAHPNSRFEVNDEEAEVLVSQYRFLKDVNDPKWSPDWHTQEQKVEHKFISGISKTTDIVKKKSNWLKRLVCRKD